MRCVAIISESVCSLSGGGVPLRSGGNDATCKTKKNLVDIFANKAK